MRVFDEMQREPTAYRSLLMVAGAVLADPEPMIARLVRGCIALAFTATVPADQSSHHHADAVKGGELSYTILAMKRKGIMHSSLLQLTGAVLAGPEPMLPRLVRGCIALAFTACVLAVGLHAATALLIPRQGQLAQLHDTSDATRATHVQIATGTCWVGHGWP